MGEPGAAAAAEVIAGDPGLESPSPTGRLGALAAARLGMGGGAPVVGELPRAGEAVRDGGLGVAAGAVTGGVPGRDSGRGMLEGVPGRAYDAESLLTARGGIGGAGDAAEDVGCCERVGVCGGVGTAAGAVGEERGPDEVVGCMLSSFLTGNSGVGI